MKTYRVTPKNEPPMEFKSFGLAAHAVTLAHVIKKIDVSLSVLINGIENETIDFAYQEVA